MPARAWSLAVACLVAVSACSPATSAPSYSPSPTPVFQVPVPEPTVTVDADGRALPGFVTQSLELPGARETDSKTLADAGAGWVLATFRPSVGEAATINGTAPGREATVQVVYLVDPEGRRYQLLELDPAVPVIIDSWTAGETVAYVRECLPDACAEAPTQVLDLTTGELSPADVEPGFHVTATLPGTTPGTSIRWWEDGTTAILERAGGDRQFGRAWQASSISPSGRYLAVERADAPRSSAGLALVDVHTGQITDVATLWPESLASCEVFRWRPDDTVDISCEDPLRLTTRVFAIGPGAREAKENKTAMVQPPAEGPWVEPHVLVTDGVWAGPFVADAAAQPDSVHPQVGIARNAGFEHLVVPDAVGKSARIVAVHDGSVYVEAEANRGVRPGLTSAWRYDVAEQRWYPLVPLPTGGPTRGLAASEGAPAWGMTSWAVAP